MSPQLTATEADGLVRQRFSGEDIEVLDVSVREYPDETIFVVFVPQAEIADAAEVGNALDEELADHGYPGFVTVRRGDDQRSRDGGAGRVSGVHDARAGELTRLVASRSRTSEAQPSLAYVRDVPGNISAATAPRHHLIFGRRGAGKTALMVEAKRTLVNDGHLSIWLNTHTLRHESVNRFFFWWVREVCRTVRGFYRDRRRVPDLAIAADRLEERVRRALEEDLVDERGAKRLIPEVQELIQRFVNANSVRLYIFIDDFYYLPRADQPGLLDILHACIRDADAWLKVASIKHLTRWFQSSPPVGLQTGHDVAQIDLDVSLQDPSLAKNFLESVLEQYARHVGVRRLSTLFSTGARDRLVLASGAVPRDYLTLSSNALTRAQARGKARLVGAQDVTQAAGDAAQAKIQELEDDLAADQESAHTTLAALTALRSFCLEEERHTYFRVDFRDKENRPSEYGALTSLLEVRLTHLLEPSVSDRRRAGERAEVFMLDLSQFSGARLKQAIRVLDLEKGVIVTKLTGRRGSTRTGRTPREVIGMYRSAPLLDLTRFGGMLEGAEGATQTALWA